MPRMKVFNALEEETFETPPVFNTAERKRYFTLPAGLDDLVESIRHGSVVSWQHINLHGEYDFSDDKLQDSIGLDLPQIVGFLQGKKWEVKNQAKPVEQMSLPEIL